MQQVAVRERLELERRDVLSAVGGRRPPCVITRSSWSTTDWQQARACRWLFWPSGPVPRLKRAIGVLYLPESERNSRYFHARLPEQFDFVLHFDETRAVEPLE